MPDSRVRFWPTFAAWVLLCATTVLVVFGALVTSLKAGMAVPDWPTTFGHAMLMYPVDQWWNGRHDVFLEHTHRVLGSFVGLCTIALTAAVWYADRRSGPRLFTVGLLVLVIAQGLLGGMRVRLNAMDANFAQGLACLHGCLAQLFFLGAAGAVYLTSQPLTTTLKRRDRAAILHRLTLTTSILFYIQIVFGALLRHFPSLPAVYFHLITAAALLWQVLSLLWEVRRFPTEPRLTFPAWALLGLLFAQGLLGAGVWISKYGGLESYLVVAYGRDQVLSTVLHVITGSALAITSMVLTCRAWQYSSPGERPVSFAPHSLEGAR